MTGIAWPHVVITGLPHGLSANPVVVAIEIALFIYFVAVNAIDFWLIASASRQLQTFVGLRRADAVRTAALPYGAAVSILVPAFNEDPHITTVVHSLLNAKYPEFEVIVINDGSTDGMLDTLKTAFALEPYPGQSHHLLRTKNVRCVYRSTKYPALRVIDKENGGKGDALNAGINEAEFSMILAADGDSLYTPDVLKEMIQPFISDPHTVGCGASLRVLNESEIVDGLPAVKRLPRNLLVRFQIVEYLRAALTSRFGWVAGNGLMSVSGACALWRRDVLVDVGGYATDTVWEDTEMTVRVHHFLRAARRPYRIAFVPTAVCWTAVPEDFGALARQRISWQRHITETVHRHRTMLFRPRMGYVGWFAFPAYAFTEWLAPLWLLAGLGFLVAAGLLGILSWEAQLSLLAVVFALTVLKGVAAFSLDESFGVHHSIRDTWALFVATMLEQIGYRQLVAIWGLIGIVQFYVKWPIRGRKGATASAIDPAYAPTV